MKQTIKVFIDGAEGTTGLRLYDRLSEREDIELLTIDPALRKDADARAEVSNRADVVFLCLPDDAAREAAARIDPSVKVIDASTAHRTADGWAYGFPELSAGQRVRVAQASRLANPGCHATGFISLVYPLVASGIATPDYPFSCHSVTGYSGAGKAMIAKYNDPSRPEYYASPRQYAMSQAHKHQAEMQKMCALTRTPIIHPIISDIYAGMVVTVPIYTHLLHRYPSAEELQRFFEDFYAGQKLVHVMPFGAESAYEGGMIDAVQLAGYDDLEIFVCGNSERVALVARFDNLGKGASGAAIQNMNIMCGLPEETGLRIYPER